MKMLFSARQKILEKIHKLTELVPDQSILQEMECSVVLLEVPAGIAESQLPSKNVQSVVSGKEGFKLQSTCTLKRQEM